MRATRSRRIRRWRAAIEHSWYQDRPIALLCPLAALFGVIAGARRALYRRGWCARIDVGVPVIVIGNITVGGAGKTPLTLAVAERLRGRGQRVGIVSRGYGGRARRYPLAVTPDTPVHEAGDEPVMLARRSGLPVAVDPRRPRAARHLIAACGVDIIVADDGLQHYALARDAEIAVIDAARGLGNGRLLPAGPLREPPARLKSVDLTLNQGAGKDFWLVADIARALIGDRRAALAAFAGQRVHAIAGIGDPERFFAMLRAAGLTVTAHARPDHHRYVPADFLFDDEAPVLMTEKDAVKCTELADSRHWMVPVTAALSADCEARLGALLDRVCARCVRK